MVIEKDWWDDCASRIIDAFGALAAKCQHVTKGVSEVITPEVYPATTGFPTKILL